MKNFQRLGVGVDVGPLVHAIQRQPELWDMFPVRSYHNLSVHREFADIVLRYNKFDWGEDFVDKVCANVECENYPPFALLPQARGLVFALMARVEGEQLGRVFISKLKPGQRIPLHSDFIEPAEKAFPDRIIPAVFYERYHIVLQSQPGVQFNCGGESVYMAPGECWWFNNQELHEVLNNSPEDRIHLVIDIHCSRYDYCPEMDETKKK